MDNSYGILNILECNLFMLKEIDKLCKKYDIKYFLDSGTLLGAIRHKGFIPWDDDVDIAMTRKEYEKFKEVSNELNEKMELICHDNIRNGKVFYDFTPRIIYKNSKRHKETKEDIYYDKKLNHLWIDIFIIDRLPKSKVQKFLVINIHKLIYLLAMGHRYEIDYKKYNVLYSIIIRIMSFIGKVIPMKLLYKLQNKISTKYNNSKSKELYYSNYQPDFLYVRLKEEWANTLTLAQFEDIYLFIPKNYDDMLKQLYNNYMSLPDTDKRKPDHRSFDIDIF